MTMLEPSPDTIPQRASRHDGLTPERQEAFLEMLAATCCVSQAAAAIGISRTALYKFRNRPDAADFRTRWNDALRESVAVLADDAFERAAMGLSEPVWYKGEQIGERVRHNDRLLMFLLRAHDPETYAPAPSAAPVRRVTRHAGTGFSPALVSTLSTSHGEDDEAHYDRRAALRALRDYPGPARRLAAKGRLPEMADDG